MKIVELANSLVGQKELPGNKFSSDSQLGKLLHEAGQKDGEAWCCYLDEALYCLAYPEHEQLFRKLFSANCVQTLENFKSHGFAISAKPVVGSLMIMRKYVNNVPQKTGHAGVPTIVHSRILWTSVEGNTNEAGAREGTTVLPKKRRLIYPTTGLRVEGFVLIRETLNITT